MGGAHEQAAVVKAWCRHPDGLDGCDAAGYEIEVLGSFDGNDFVAFDESDLLCSFCGSILELELDE